MFRPPTPHFSASHARTASAFFARNSPRHAGEETARLLIELLIMVCPAAVRLPQTDADITAGSVPAAARRGREKRIPVCTTHESLEPPQPYRGMRMRSSPTSFAPVLGGSKAKSRA